MQEVMGTIKARIVQYTVIQIYTVYLRFPFWPSHIHWSNILMNLTNFNGVSQMSNVKLSELFGFESLYTVEKI